MNQTTIFDMMYSKYKITKPIRLIELFSGYGSQALALKYLGVKFEHWRTCEWAIKSIQAYKDIHCPNDIIHFYKEKSKEEMVDLLFKKGISANYNEPMAKEQISRLSETQLKDILSNIYITNDMVNIQRVTANELDIVDTDKYEYIMTYSFPCQDLSLAGKGKGMSDTSTRSGMLWEVERILTECKELGTMPQVLLMENVPQVHSVDNMPDFHKWQVRLEELGYKSYWQDLIATDYGIPQTRNRCFMISILGDYSYTFPKPIPLKLKLKDMLEDNVDEKYYLSDKMIDFYIFNTEKQKENGNGFKFEPITKDEAKICKTITTRSGSRMDDNYITNKPLRETLEKYNNKIVKTNQFIDSYNRTIRNDDLSCTISTRIDASNNNYLLVKNATKEGYLETTKSDNFIKVKKNTENYIEWEEKGKIQMNCRAWKDDKIVATLNTGGETKILVKNATKQGYLEATDGDGVDISSRMEYHRGNVQKDKIQTITTSGGNDRGVVTLGNYSPSNHNASRIVDKEAVAPTVMENHGTITATQTNDLRIRKLTPRECFRLMGVKDEDFDKVKKNQSDASLYHLAGDSIVVNVLMAIFKELLERKGEE